MVEHTLTEEEVRSEASKSWDSDVTVLIYDSGKIELTYENDSIAILNSEFHEFMLEHGYVMYCFDMEFNNFHYKKFTTEEVEVTTTKQVSSFE